LFFGRCNESRDRQRFKSIDCAAIEIQGKLAIVPVESESSAERFPSFKLDGLKSNSLIADTRFIWKNLVNGTVQFAIGRFATTVKRASRGDRLSMKYLCSRGGFLRDLQWDTNMYLGSFQQLQINRDRSVHQPRSC
jgi:hypothetical protein